MYKKFLYAVGLGEKRFTCICFHRFTLLLGLLLSVTFNTRAEAAGPLRVSAANPRYFTDQNNKAVYLAGTYLNEYNLLSGSWDFVSYLEYLQQQNHNFTRVWGWEQSPWSFDDAQHFSFTVQPYERTGPGLASDGDLKFDLSRFNQAYFDQLRSRVIAAAERGIYVSVMLFEGFSNQKKVGQVNPWLGDPFQQNNNINGIDGDPNQNGGGEEFFSLAVPSIVSLQEAFVRKVVDTLNDLDNVLYEVSANGLASSLEWQYHMVDYLKAYQATKPNQHLVGISQFNSSTLNEALASSADWIVIQASNLNPAIADQNKAIFLEADPVLFKSSSSYQWIWKSFSRGYNVTYLEPTAPNATINGALHVAIGQTVAYSQFVNFTSLYPSSTLCSTRYCLADAGREYLVYLPSGGRMTLDLGASRDSFLPTWFAPATGTTVSGSPISGGTKVSLKPPFRGGAVLELQKQLPQQASIDSSSGISPEQTAATKASSSASSSNTVATPTITPNGGIYSGSVSVSLQTTTSKAAIYYTTDGQSPTQSSQRYTKPFVLTASTLVKAKAFKNNLASSEASAWFSNAAASNFNFALANSGNISIVPGSSAAATITAALSTGSAQGVSFSISGIPAGASASLSSTSCNPTCSTVLTITTSATTPAGSSTVTVTAVGGGLTRTTSFTLTVALPAAATPTISPSGGSYTGSVVVSIQTATSSAQIYYTTDGSTPTQSSKLYAGAITLTSSTAVKAKAFKSGYNSSAETSASFTISQPVPTMTVTVDSTYSGYTSGPIDDGVINAAGATNSTWASAETSTDHWINIAFPAPRQLNSAVIYWAYNTYSQTYMTAQRVNIQYWDGSSFQTISSVTYPGSDVSSSPAYFATVTTSQLRFLMPAGMGNPAYPSVLWVTELDYGIDLVAPLVTAPIITPPGGSFTDGLIVTMQTSTSGASIYYTIDGSTPTQSSTLYNGPITVTATTDIKAKAFKAGYTPSSISSAVFTGSIRTGTTSGTTYYVAKTGSDANNCTANSKCLTIAKGLSVMSSGDTLVISAGTYTEAINYDQIVSGGGSWETATTVKGAPGETVVLRPATGGGGGDAVWLYSDQSYIILDNLVIDGANVAVQGVRISPGAHHIRLSNSEIKNARYNNCVGGGGATDQEILYNRVHDCGTSNYHHGIYVQGSNNLIEGNDVYNITGFGIHQYHEGMGSDNNNVIRYNTVHNVGSAGPDLGSGIVAGSGTNSQVYGNVVYNAFQYGIELGFWATNPAAYNNTIYASGSYCIHVRNSSTGAAVKNNLCIANGNTAMLDEGVGTAVSNNRFTASIGDVADAANHVFTLRPNSTTIDAGVDLSSIFTTDRNGIPLPQGSSYDIGAYEYVP